MMVDWPAELPRYPLLGTSSPFPDLALATAMEVGPAKVRRRFVAGVRSRSVEWLLSTAQLERLMAFYLDDLGGGVLPFNLTHPVTDRVARMRFKAGSPPREEQVGPDDYRVTAELEELP